MKVDVVKGCFNFVHHVERRWAATEDGKQEGQSGEAALSTRQQTQLLDVLATRLGFNFNTRVQQVIGVGEN